MSPVREAELQSWILDAAGTLGWLSYHTHDSRRSAEGFPDLVLVRGSYLLHREVKVSTRPSVVTPPQRRWLHRLRDAGADADVWTFDDWPARVVEDLTHPGQQPVRGLPPRPTDAEVVRWLTEQRRRAYARRS